MQTGGRGVEIVRQLRRGAGEIDACAAPVLSNMNAGADMRSIIERQIKLSILQNADHPPY